MERQADDSRSSRGTTSYLQRELTDDQLRQELERRNITFHKEQHLLEQRLLVDTVDLISRQPPDRALHEARQGTVGCYSIHYTQYVRLRYSLCDTPVYHTDITRITCTHTLTHTHILPFIICMRLSVRIPSIAATLVVSYDSQSHTPLTLFSF